MILCGEFSFPEDIMYSWDNSMGLNHGINGHVLLEIFNKSTKTWKIFVGQEYIN